ASQTGAPPRGSPRGCLLGQLQSSRSWSFLLSAGSGLRADHAPRLVLAPSVPETARRGGGRPHLRVEGPCPPSKTRSARACGDWASPILVPPLPSRCQACRDAPHPRVLPTITTTRTGRWLSLFGNRFRRGAHAHPDEAPGSAAGRRGTGPECGGHQRTVPPAIYAGATRRAGGRADVLPAVQLLRLLPVCPAPCPTLHLLRLLPDPAQPGP